MCQSISRLLPKSGDYPHTAFSFIGNASLAGSPNPCADFVCRSKAVDELSRFAALYADEVSIPNQFQYFYEFLGENNLEYAKREISIHVKILWNIKPLIEAGIIFFTDYKYLQTCTSCYPKSLSEAIPSLYLNPDKMQNYLHNRFLKEASFDLVRVG